MRTLAGVCAIAASGCTNAQANTVRTKMSGLTLLSLDVDIYEIDCKRLTTPREEAARTVSSHVNTR
jgi:hypothetical protein